MNVSVINDLPQKNDGEIKRRRKIQYRRTKSRLISKTSGILNRSISLKNVRSGENAVGSGNQVIAVKDVNSFLTRNHELAKALEESRSQAKELEKDKFLYQMECLQMQEKLAIYQNAVINCVCGKKNKQDDSILGNIKLLVDMDSTLQQSITYLKDYMTSLAMLKATKDYSNLEPNSLYLMKNTPTPLLKCENKYTQTEVPAMKNVRTQCERVVMKNKKLQVRSSPDLDSAASKPTGDIVEEESKVYEDKCTQYLGDNLDRVSQGTQCSLTPEIRSNMTQKLNNSQKGSTSKLGEHVRQPLSVINANNIGEVRPNCVLKKPTSILKVHDAGKPKKNKAVFHIYEDNTSKDKENYMQIRHNSLKSKKKVTIHSPAAIRIFESFEEQTEQIQLRKRRNTRSYKEPALNRKLSKADPTVDTRFYASPFQRGKKARRKKVKKSKLNITLEDVINLVLEESYLKGGASFLQAVES